MNERPGTPSGHRPVLANVIGPSQGTGANVPRQHILRWQDKRSSGASQVKYHGVQYIQRPLSFTSIFILPETYLQLRTYFVLASVPATLDQGRRGDLGIAEVGRHADPNATSPMSTDATRPIQTETFVPPPPDLNLSQDLLRLARNPSHPSAEKRVSDIARIGNDGGMCGASIGWETPPCGLSEARTGGQAPAAGGIATSQRSFSLPPTSLAIRGDF